MRLDLLKKKWKFEKALEDVYIRTAPIFRALKNERGDMIVLVDEQFFGFKCALYLPKGARKVRILDKSETEEILLFGVWRAINLKLGEHWPEEYELRRRWKNEGVFEGTL